ncbi:DIRP domain-containing protein [Phytophthora infestans]|uniref:DIRP domain-containing protein n=1 Tax=Phytophthora infestans TaxID=4787 RepID=A0A833SAM4_PHYIN|nr:DIRP domain-containing protein [Phytophthora infestans]
MLQSKRVLGPRWSSKELRTFYILLKAHGQQWDKLVECLPLRSEAMVRALFEMHRGYLSLPEASAEGFCAIMMDRYEMQDEMEQRKTNASASLSLDVDGDVIMDVKQEIGDGQEPAARSRKKRRLEKLLATDQLATLHIQKEKDDHAEREERISKKRGGRKGTRPMKARAWLPRQDERDDTGLGRIHGARFDLPWFHWFYSYMDVDFFRHNEFIECLGGMGLGKITAAARPIWSSVRASMGRPRRLSPLFFSQEKEKLESYRAVKRRLDPAHLPTGRTWPYRCTAPLRRGAPVIVWRETERCFRLATVGAFRATEETCQVFFCDNISRIEAVPCNLENVMVLDLPPWSRTSEDSNTESKLAATTLLRRESGARGGMSAIFTQKTVHPIGDRYQEEKIRVVLAVKSLLQRKEKIISALSSLNERVTEQQMRLHEKNAMKSSLWTTPTAFSSAAVKNLVWSNPVEKAQMQKQHAWLAANLEATNTHLKAALLSLQSFSANNNSETVNAATTPGYSADALAMGSDCSTLPTETLAEDQMRWAIDFLAASKQKAASVVAESALQVVKDDKELGSDTQLGRVLPETMPLVANCVTLMSVLHRHVAASPDVPAAVTQTLVERVLELLKPTHEANMDLYAELRSAAEATQAQMALLATTTDTD